MTYDSPLQIALMVLVGCAFDRFLAPPWRRWTGFVLFASGVYSLFLDVWTVFGVEIALWKSTAIALGCLLMMRSNRYLSKD
ncbi:hypothetical protein DZC75_14145 [Pseudomonas parafulva]|uniref:Uncharacterized protein n=1 Tax=Pseudomonas parafulva TaxID=157782 RepID=A0AAI8PC48_9PSED|nr:MULTISPECIES: hypothetical protein [Pseudomonas]AIZ33419.1 hypothetical protein NJ69_10700 [Pseudomonas parafulva]AXO89087.1 hypothetical protein DZC75_14145 [Pseudomonas parafulva]MDV9034128.1 hypothetical protein [Pseudomonas sp. RAC1]